MEGAHEALVEEKLWRRAQDRLRARGAAFAHGARRAAPDGALPYILSGVVRCSCGRTMVGGGGIPKDATEAERLKWRRYQCKACRGSVQQSALESALFGAVANFFREADEDGRLEKRMRAWVERQVAAGDAEAQASRRADLERRKARLVRLAEETDDGDVTARLREVSAELKALASETADRPDPRALKAHAARWLDTVRKAFKWKREPDAATVNRELAALRPIILEAIWDRDERTVEVNLRPFTETGLALVPRAPRARHSDYNGLWRAQA
ncbi:MAG TPA: hypothetical protein VJN62_11800, partial [Gemmatimonadales bacterium]|nr:hypothetical protein [Gemmatimonadales bacterium]